MFLGENVASKLKGNPRTIINRCSDKIVSSAVNNGLVVIVELT